MFVAFVVTYLDNCAEIIDQEFPGIYIVWLNLVKPKPIFFFQNKKFGDALVK